MSVRRGSGSRTAGGMSVEWRRGGHCGHLVNGHGVVNVHDDRRVGFGLGQGSEV